MAGTDADRQRLESVPAGAWDRLAKRRIYFGHQSVGFDIMAGVEEALRLKPALKIRVVESGEPRSIDGPALAHSTVGANLDPASKLKAFADALRTNVPWIEVAILKYCYADIRGESQVAQEFTAYSACMASLERELPGVTLLHATVPLTSLPSGARQFAKRILGKPVRELADNIAREEFNAKLRERFGPSGRLFDIARLESTRPDGGAQTCGRGAQSCPAMFHGYTRDRGHLGDLGRRIVGREFLRFLAEAAA